MRSLKNTDRFWEIGAGEIDRFTVLNIFGRNPDVDTGTDPEDVWNYGGTQTHLTVPQSHYVSSSAAANDDDQVIQINGLDQNWDIQIVNVTPNNQTAVIIPQGNSANTYILGFAALVAGPPAGTRISQATSGAFLTVVSSDTTHNTITGYVEGTPDLVGGFTDPSLTMNPDPNIPTSITACSLWLRINGAVNISANALNGNLYIAEQDTLAVGLPTTAIRVRGVILIGMERMQNTHYCVPRSHNAYVWKGWSTMNAAITGAAVMHFYVGFTGLVYRCEFVFGLDAIGSSHFQYEFPVPYEVPGMTDLKVVAGTTTVDDADISAGYQIVLEDLRVHTGR